MAPDEFHHLEGTLKFDRELRIYFYDNHTRAISASPYVNLTDIQVQRMASNGNLIGSRIRLSPQLNWNHSFIQVKLPEQLHRPLYFFVQIHFRGDKESTLFNFLFP